MIISDQERKFLAGFIFEATTDPFSGPHTAELHRREIYYTDLPHLLTAYYRERERDQEGFGGKQSLTPPACPWLDRESALRRNREVAEALEKTATGSSS